MGPSKLVEMIRFKLRKEDSRRLIYCILLFFFALGLRLLYANIVLGQFAELRFADQTSNEMGYLTHDSPGYLEPAVDLMKGRIAQAVSLIRPIGYPAFLALLRANPIATLHAQALLLSLIPVCTFLLVSVLTAKNLLAFAAGLASSMSPSGIAIGSLIMSDALFASLFAVLFTAMVYGTLRNSVPWILFSALVSGLAILVKPILLFWPIVAVMVSALIAGFQDGSQNGLGRWLQIDKSRRTQMFVLFFVPALFIISWAAVNYAENGIFTVSIIGNLTVREYLATKAEEWGMAGHRPSNAAVTQNQNVLRKRLATLTVQEEAHAVLPESIAIFEEYPTQTIKAFVDDALENSLSGWDYFSRQLPFSQQQLGGVFSKIRNLESRFRQTALLMMLFAPFIGLAALRVNPSPYERRLVSTLFAMTLTFLSFLALSGTTFWTGPRIVYPAEILEISTAAILVAMLVRTIGHLRGQRRPGESRPTAGLSEQL
jgi:hypothetical protein